MKLYTTPPPKKLTRLTFRKQGYNYEYLLLKYEPLEEVKKKLEKLITDNIKIDPFATSKRIGIDIREYEGKKAGQSISLSFKSEVTPKELQELIFNILNK
nr:hypothetical protein [uncultured Flavobacterium sp.]